MCDKNQYTRLVEPMQGAYFGVLLVKNDKKNHEKVVLEKDCYWYIFVTSGAIQWNTKNEADINETG